MVKPNFLIIGAAKAGTTSLYHYLNQHPQIYMSPLKETNYFALAGKQLIFRGPGDHDYINRFSLTTIDAYQAQFEGVTHERAIGEASPLYLYEPHVPQRIRRHLKNVKLIAILRHPVERAYSAFLHLVRDGREQCATFAHALEQEHIRIASHWEHIWHYKQMGLYYQQLKRYYDCFAPAQIKVYLYDMLKADPHRVIQDIFRFLHVDDTYAPDISIRYNVSRASETTLPPLLPEVRSQLSQAFRDDLLRLESLIQIDLSGWLDHDHSVIKRHALANAYSLATSPTTRSTP